MRLRHFLIPLLIASLLGVASCSKPQIPTTHQKSIVVTYSVLGAVVRELVSGKAVVTVAIPNGLDPHDWEPSARDIETINKADLIVQNGLGLETGMEKALAAAKKKGIKFFTASDYITVRHVGPGEGIPSGDPDQVVGAPDPHLWMDPLAMKSIIAALTDELMNDFNIDVSGTATSLGLRLDTLNQQVTDTLAVVSPENRKLITGHESMGYFAERYGFKLVGVIIPSLSSQAGVSAADLAALKKAVEDNHVKAIFTELGTSPAVARVIGNETGAKVVEITTHALPGDLSYFTFMRNLATVIAGALK